MSEKHNKDEAENFKEIDKVTKRENKEDADMISFLKGEHSKMKDDIVESSLPSDYVSEKPTIIENDDERKPVNNLRLNRKDPSDTKRNININKPKNNNIKINKPSEPDKGKNIKFNAVKDIPSSGEENIPKTDKPKWVERKKQNRKDDNPLEHNSIFDNLDSVTTTSIDDINDSDDTEELDESMISEVKNKQPEKKKSFFSKLFGGKDKKKKPKKKKEKKLPKKTKKQRKKPKKNEKISRKKQGKKNKENKAGEINKEEKIKKSLSREDESSALIQEKYRKMKTKRIITTTMIILVMIALIIFGTYNTFFKLDKSANQIAAEVNAINRTTPFPDGGLEGFLKQNMNEMMEKNIKLDKDVTEYNINPTDLYITSISKRSSDIANVYFTAKIKTNKGENYHNFFVAVKYDYENYAYSPASEVQISPNTVKNDINIEDNQILSFSGINKVEEEKGQKVETFVNNFLMMMYNEEVDITPYYDGGDTLGDPNSKFVRIVDFEMYEDYNINRYNARVVYVLKLNEGLEYEVTNYLNIEPTSETGSSYIIKSIL